MIGTPMDLRADRLGFVRALRTLQGCPFREIGMKTFKRAAARLCVAWLMGASGAVAQAGLLGDHTVTEVPVTGIGEVRLSFPTLLPNGDLLDPSTLINMVSACWCRSKFDPPCRLNFDPGLGAGIG